MTLKIQKSFLPSIFMEEEKRDKALLAITKDPNRFIKSNPIINAKFDITAVQMKVFLKVIASVDQSNDDTPLVSISVKEFQSFLGGKAKNMYKYLETELSKLRKKDIIYEDERIKLEASFFSSIEYKKKEGYFEFEFSKKIKPFLLQIKENFTILDIRNLLYLDSIYAIRFYEFCKEYERFKGFEFDVDELKDKFGLQDRYKNYFDFKLKVLNQARTELMNRSELYFDYEEIKVGKKVVRLKFKIISNKNKNIYIDDFSSINHEESIAEIHEIVGEYVSQETVRSWFNKFSEEQIVAGVSYTIEEYKKGKVKDLAGFLQKMVATPAIVSGGASKKKSTKPPEAKQEQADLFAFFEEEQRQFKTAYFEKKKQLALDLLTTNKKLFTELLKALKKKNTSESPGLLAELAFKNYKTAKGVGLQYGMGTVSDFLMNFNDGGVFQSYMLEELSVRFGEFSALRGSLVEKAQAIGLKEYDLF